ncbi:MAG: hypothetical protein IJI68_09145 [Eggerthellaceae bacterium]|nr:hypothetical protein [Eggerthellaceae bacterium]
MSESTTAKRTVTVESEANKGLTTQDLILIAVLLAAGAVLKLTVASFLSFAGMKPNFVIAMYCLAIILTRPKLPQAIIIGLIAGIMCQIPMLNATPLVNIPSEVLGALACGLLIHIPLNIGGKLDINPIVTTFLSTVVSGYTFAIIVGTVNGLALPVIFVTYAVMVFGTATFNAILVQILTPLLRKVLKK